MGKPKTLEYYEPVEPKDEPEKANDLERVLRELGNLENSTVKIERYRKGKPMEYVDVYQADTFTLKLLQDTYGGGDYRVEGRNAQGEYEFRRPVSIAEPIRPTVAQPMDVVAAIQDSFRQQNELIMKMIMMQSRAVPAQVPAPETNRLQLLEEIKTIKDIFSPADTQNTAEKSLDLIKMGLDFGRDINGGETSNMDVLLKGMEVFSKPLANAIEISNDQNRAGAISTPEAMPSKPPPQDPKQIARKRQAMDMKTKTAFLIQQAATDADPAAVAEIVLSYVSKEQLENFLGDDPLAYLAKVNPKIMSYRPWFEQLANEIKLTLEFEKEPDVSTSGGATETETKVN